MTLTRVLTLALALSAFWGSAHAQILRCGNPDSCDFSASRTYMASKALTGPVEIRVVFVDFATNPDVAMNSKMSAELWSEWTDFMSAQSRGAHELHVEIVTPLNPLDEIWTADYGSDVYGSASSVAPIARYSSYWSPRAVFDGTGHMGELQAEILLKIQASYTGHANPFAGADVVIFVCLPFAGDNPLLPGIGGIRGLAVKKDAFALLADVAYDPSDVDESVVPQSSWRPLGIAMNWWGGGVDYEWSTAQILAHEYGHVLGLVHTSTCSLNVCGAPPALGDKIDDYYWGPYSLMRRVLLGGRSFIPFHELDLWRLGWVNRVLVSENMRNVEIRDLRSGGSVYCIDGVSPTMLNLGPIVQRWDNCFAIALHAGINEDARPIVGGGTMYPSRGLAVWHYLQSETIGSGAPRATNMADLETATGLYANPETGTVPDTIWGGDYLDVWFNRTQSCAYREVEDAIQYGGAASDFFGGSRAEFSYRTNPSTNGYRLSGPPDANTVFRLYPQSALNSVIVRILEDNGSTMQVDILLAPFEAVLSPNGGNVLQVGQPHAITWSKEFTTDQPNGIVNAVDIYCIRGAGSSDQLVASGVDATLGTYTWTPDATQVGTTCKIKVVCHNVNDTTHVGEDWTSPGFVDTPQVVAEARSNASGLTSPMWPWRRL